MRTSRLMMKHSIVSASSISKRIMTLTIRLQDWD